MFWPRKWFNSKLGSIYYFLQAGRGPDGYPDRSFELSSGQPSANKAKIVWRGRKSGTN